MGHPKKIEAEEKIWSIRDSMLSIIVKDEHWINDRDNLIKTNLKDVFDKKVPEMWFYFYVCYLISIMFNSLRK